MIREEAIESFKRSNEQAKLRLEVEKMRMDSGEIKELEFYIERDEMAIKALEQEPKTGQYEKHIDHTDCIWYGNDSGCPVTCSQYRDGWNDAMDYIFKNGKGYQPYRHDG